ncbi:MAG: ABC transporter permease [Candidatus Vogelbacteria bacterium]|nr:ABC transporter permease [Candidatus Vogelbacteria bacterium]
MINFKRVIKQGIINFWRNGIISFASLLVMVVTLSVVGALILGGSMLDAGLSLLRDRVDINIYFRTDASEKDILALRDSLTAIPAVKKVDYTTREEALSDFKDRHKDNPLILNSLDELSDNPLGATLAVRADDPSRYEDVARYLEENPIMTENGINIIDKVNYYQNKKTIDKLSKIIDSSQKLGFAVALLFAVIVVLVTFNTVRLAIFISKEEIAVMRLVGASNWYIRGPFIIAGMLYGLLGSIIVVLLFYPATSWVGGATANFFGGINVHNFYLQNLVQIFGVLLLTGLFLGAISSFMAVRKYLSL